MKSRVKSSEIGALSENCLTVVERKVYHFLAVATVLDLQNSYWNQ